MAKASALLTPDTAPAPDGVLFLNINSTTGRAVAADGSTYTFDAAKGWQKDAQ